MMTLAQAALLALVVLGMLPTLALFAQFLAVGLHGLRNHYARCGDYTPRVAFVLPAWNEAAVLGASIDSLMRLAYPAGNWRIYVVDDASTDATPEVLHAKMAQYPGAVFHLRRDKGGEGKAHTLNHGLRHILAEDWAQAVMIMDADVLFEPTSLRRMTRHLADPRIGSVTAYVKEGSHPGNLVTRFIAYEYIAAQAAARRAQNVGGTLACLAGGAQLHSRANLDAIGGRIDTSSLAEDTYTTFATQLSGRRVLFEGNAVVWAEEPDSLAALWKQRLRWARGNLQITRAFGHLWLRPWRHRGLGGIGFGIVWLSILLTPVLAVISSIGLLGLYALGDTWAWAGFTAVWRITIAVYLFETLYAFLIDPATARRAWLQGLLFPGVISLAIMLALVVPSAWSGLAFDPSQPASGALQWLLPVMYAWNSLSMLAAWAVYRLEKIGLPDFLRNALLLLVGYGAFMNAIAFAAMIAQWRKVELRWDKTQKSGKARIPQ